MERFASAMREARARKKMSQKELSEKTGIATSTISSYESGGKVPPLDIAIKIAKALSLSLDALFEINAVQCENNTFGKVIRLINELNESPHKTFLALSSLSSVADADMRIELRLKAADDLHNRNWAKGFASKWSTLLDTVTEEPDLREMYSAWLEKKIDEAKACKLDELPF